MREVAKKRDVMTRVQSIGSLLFGIGAMAFVATANAQSETFATFTQRGGNTPFEFTNGSLSVASAIPVNFQFQVGNTYGATPGDSVAAFLTFTSTPGSATAVLGDTVFQRLNNIVATFTAAAPVNNQSNLLTMSASGLLYGTQNSYTPSLIGTQSATSIDTVEFTSDFLDFSGPFNQKSYSISFTNANPTISLDSYGDFANFSASGTGVFATDPVLPTPPPTNGVPEPATLGLLGLGLVSSLLAKRKKINRVSSCLCLGKL